MLNKLRPALALAGLIALSAYGAPISSGAPNNNQAINYSNGGAGNTASNKQPAESFWDRTWSDPLDLYTLLLAVFTGALVIVSAVQIRFLIRADKTAKISADAAYLSARAAIALQLPIIRIEPETIGHGDSIEGEVHTEFCWVHFLTFFNLGPTKAFPIEIRCGWTVGGELPGEPSYLAAETFLPNLIFEPDPKLSSQKRLEFDIPLKPGEWSLICGDKLNFWFYCIFTYEDFMQTRHGARFCWRWRNIGMGMGWRIDDTPAYNQKT